MIFSRKAKYKLPKFPVSVVPAFRQLCREIPVDQVDAVRAEVERCIGTLRERAPERPNLNLPLAEEIAARCFVLLDRFPDYDVEKRKLVMGAVSYFVVDGDGAEDDSFATGFDDDARVMNYVLQQVGIEDQFIDLR